MGESTILGITDLGGTTTPDALPTLSELRDRVFTVLRDSERAFVLDGDVDYWLNEALLDLNARLRLKQTRATGTTASDGTIDYPSDLVEPISLWIGTSRVQFTDDETFESYAETGTTPFVTLGRIFSNTIETYPEQESEAYTLRYVSRPTLLSADTDQPTDLTPELCVRLVMYARGEAKKKEGEQGEGADYMNQYLEGLPGRPRVGHRMRPGTVDMIPQTSIFDE